MTTEEIAALPRLLIVDAHGRYDYETGARLIATVQAEEAGRKAAEERYRSAELSVVACKQRREEAEERKRAAEEQADALRAVLDDAAEFIERVTGFTGSDPDEAHDVLDAISKALGKKEAG